MAILTTEEKADAIAEFQLIIESTGDLATIIRPDKTEVQPSDPFGKIESSEAVIVTNVPVEFISLDPTEVIQEGHDKIGNVLPNTDVKENDFIIDQSNTNIRYRITDVVKHNLFGAITHLELKLERAYVESP